jgi:hypothetical protein
MSMSPVISFFAFPITYLCHYPQTKLEQLLFVRILLLLLLLLTEQP